VDALILIVARKRGIASIARGNRTSVLMATSSAHPACNGAAEDKAYFLFGMRQGGPRHFL
jgi:hypothetical protein